MNIFNRLFGSLAAIILYPIKSVLVNLLLLALTLIAALAAIIFIPLLFAFVYLTRYGGIIETLFAGVFIFIITAVVILYQVAGQLLDGVFDVVKSIKYGATDGFAHGFSHALKNSVKGFVVFSSQLQRVYAYLISRMSGRQPLNQNEINSLNGDNDFEAADYSQFVDVEKSPLEVPSLDNQENRCSVLIPLTENERSKARSVGALKTLLEQYEGLYQRLEVVDNALRTQQGMPDDEVVTYMEIDTPSLFVQEYLNDAGKWMAVPASTKITDKATMTQCFMERGKDPLTNNDIQNPPPYEGKKTRYRFYAYVNMNNAKELQEAAASIRQQLRLLDASNLPSISQTFNGMKVFANTFFDGPEAENNNDDDDDNDFIPTSTN